MENNLEFNWDKFGILFNENINKLNPEKHDYNKKVKELFYVGKFLILLKENFSIMEVDRESPDFIISNSFSKIGIELETKVNEDYKEQEGSIEQLFKQVKQDFTKKYPDKKYLVNIFIKENFPTLKKNKTDLIIKELNLVIVDYINNGILSENRLIDYIYMMPYDQLDFQPNMGAWMQRTLTEDNINKAIEKKEKKLQKYIENSCTKEQWLLIVIGSQGKSSFQMNDNIKSVINSGFTRIYILEDSNRIINRLK